MCARYDPIRSQLTSPWCSQLVFEHGDKKLVLDPLTGEIDPEISDYTVGKFKIEVRLRKKYPGRWVRLVGGSELLSRCIHTSDMH